jgi:hypothetical protein
MKEDATTVFVVTARLVPFWCVYINIYSVMYVNQYKNRPRKTAYYSNDPDWGRNIRNIHSAYKPAVTIKSWLFINSNNYYLLLLL